MWLRAEESDWLRGIRLSALPKDRAMRALWRSPVSVHVLSHSKHNMNNKNHTNPVNTNNKLFYVYKK
jgi:hypothetical protein